MIAPFNLWIACLLCAIHMHDSLNPKALHRQP